MAVFECGEILCAGGGDGGIARDDFFGQTAVGFEAEREGDDIEQQPFAAAFVARQHIGLHGCAERDDFVGVEVVERGLAEEGGDGLLDVQHSGRAANHNHAFDVGFGHARVFQCLFHRLDGFLHEMAGEVVKFLTGNGGAERSAV